MKGGERGKGKHGPVERRGKAQSDFEKFLGKKRRRNRRVAVVREKRGSSEG